jgi:RNA polymerase sigma factor (sigma-70 family)
MTLTTDRDALVDVSAAVRRALAARTSDPHLIDDLTQETLLRLARSDRPLTADERRAYAVVTARNLLASHFRGQSVQRRHQHRLVDHGDATDPEQRTIDNEETAALASALTRLDPGERELLLRHEVTGTDLSTLAGEAEVSRGAIAMRLARARANLRLEFLLVFRRLSLPTSQCRPVLLALSVGDRRRQAQLDAVGHLETCATCSTLLKPMTERDRRVAGWLIVPIGDAARRVRRAFRSWWVRAVTVTMLLAALGGLIVLVNGRSGPDDKTSDPQDSPNSVLAAPRPTPAATPAITVGTEAPPPSAGAPTTASTDLATAPTTADAEPAAPAATPVPSPPPSPPVAPSTVAAPAAAAACPPPAALTELDLPAAVGCPFAVSVVTVVAVPTGAEVAATAGSWSVAIRLIGGGGLPLSVVPGVRLSIVGTVAAAPGANQLAVIVNTEAIRIGS